MFNFPIHREHRFRLNGRSYSVGRSGVKTIKLLERLYDYFWKKTHGSKNNYTKGSAREWIREIEQLDKRTLLVLVIKNTDNELLRLLAVWMRGRCGGVIGTKLISRLADSKSAIMRKEVTRALKRMSGWSTLRLIADNDPVQRIRIMAQCQPSKPIRARIQQFVGNEQHAGNRAEMAKILESEQSLYVDDEWKRRAPTLPKSSAWIRSILKRIRNLVAKP